jgi:hypothetical protein
VMFQHFIPNSVAITGLSGTAVAGRLGFVAPGSTIPVSLLANPS